tara:strand:- start:6870 stop:8042 length:1173 start_codon:yes stop_codon:yes gene_type:complete
MVIQPATGAKDLNPQQVEVNRCLTNNLAYVYKLWGFEEVSPPRIERMETLKAGGAIQSSEIVKLVTDEPLGLRPEMTASIARSACTRLANKTRPLRLWASGTVFESRESVEGGQLIEEHLQSGVEIFGIKDISGEIELMSLLLHSYKKLEISNINETTLLIGHTSLINMIISRIPEKLKTGTKNALVDFNNIFIEDLEIDIATKDLLKDSLKCRGDFKIILDKFKSIFGEDNELDKIYRLLNAIQPIANEHNVKLQLDPTFLPQYDLYTGLVFQLICKGKYNSIVIARGGRYDELVETFSSNLELSSGLGFCFSIDKIRDISEIKDPINSSKDSYLILYDQNSKLEKALSKQQEIHKSGCIAIIQFINTKEAIDENELLRKRYCNKIISI